HPGGRRPLCEGVLDQSLASRLAREPAHPRREARRPRPDQALPERPRPPEHAVPADGHVRAAQPRGGVDAAGRPEHRRAVRAADRPVAADAAAEPGTETAATAAAGEAAGRVGPSVESGITDSAIVLRDLAKSYGAVHAVR